MKYANILDEAREKLLILSDELCFGEIENILYSQESENQDLYSEACQSLGLKVGGSGNAVITDENVLLFAAMSIIYSDASGTNASIPIFFNQERENIEVALIDDLLYLLVGMDIISTIEPDLKYQFLRTMNSYKNNYFMSASSILELIQCYAEIGDVNVAISDYVLNIRGDEELLCDFTTKDVVFVKNENPQAKKVLKNMHSCGRLDVCSLDAILKGIA